MQPWRKAEGWRRSREGQGEIEVEGQRKYATTRRKLVITATQQIMDFHAWVQELGL